MKKKAKESVDRGNYQVGYLIIAGLEYEIKTEFLTERMNSGKCYIILCDDGRYHGIDSGYFEN